MPGPRIQWEQLSPEVQERFRTNEGAYFAFKTALIAVALSIVGIAVGGYALLRVLGFGP